MINATLHLVVLLKIYNFTDILILYSWYLINSNNAGGRDSIFVKAHKHIHSYIYKECIFHFITHQHFIKIISKLSFPFQADYATAYNVYSHVFHVSVWKNKYTRCLFS